MIREGFAAERIERSSVDWTLVGLLVLLLGLGLTTLFSASYYYAGITRKSPFFFVKRQALIAVFGLTLAFVASQTPLDLVKKSIPLLLLVSLVLMLLTFVPSVGKRILGARRWLNIFGWSFQPSELAAESCFIYPIFEQKEENIMTL